MKALAALLLSILVIGTSNIFGQYKERQLAAQVSNGYQTKFWIYNPADYPNSGSYPLLICLHGGSGIGDDLEMLKEPDHEPPAYLIDQNQWFDLPFIVVSPQLKRDLNYPDHNEQNWPPDLVDEVIEYVKTIRNIDSNRIYVTGVSLGAAGVWNYAVTYPTKVAAIMPIGGKSPRADACSIKDVPIWAFHGENDGFVPNRFTTDMVSAITACQPPGNYIPHVNLTYSMGHEAWWEIYNLTGGYDVYTWLLSFVKGNLSNKAPFVFTGKDRKILNRPGPIYLTAEYFDSDGTIQSIQWSQVNNGSPSLTLSDTGEEFLEIVNPVVGTFIFRLTVIDNDGASSSDDITLTITSANDARAITAMTLTNYDGTSLPGSVNGVLSDGKVFDLNEIGNRINILPAFTNAGKVRWSINSDQNTRKLSKFASPFYLKQTTGSGLNPGWTVAKGDYLVCATPFENTDFEEEGTSLCYKITFTDEPPGLMKYYSKTGADLSLLSSWGTEVDGSGATPVSLNASNQRFFVRGTALISTSPIDIGSNRLVVESSGHLTISNTFSGLLYVEGNGIVTITTNNVIQSASLVSLSRTSTFKFDGSALTIPAANYGNLIIRGNGQKTIATGFGVVVNGDLTIEQGSDVISPGGNHGITITGHATIGNASSVPYVLQFLNGFGNQNLTLPGSYTFRDLIVQKGCTANIIAPGTSTITLGSAAGGGRAEIHDYSLLKLNGHNLNLTNSAAINPNSSTGLIRSGRIECDNSTISITTTSTTTALNFYPATGKNNLKTLDINIPQGHSGLNIMAPLNVTNNVKISNGKINSNGNMTLVSTPSSTAFISPVIGGGLFVGNVNVQRSIPAGTVYRYLAFPVSGATVAGLQQHIPVNGDFDGNSGASAASLFYYNEASTGWIEYPKRPQTNSAGLTIGRGYATKIFDNTNPEHITVSGTLNTGNFSFTSASLLASNTTLANDKGWTLLGNPYAAPVKWAAPTSGGAMWDGSGINSTVYVRANTNGTDKYVFHDGQVGSGSFNGNIASGQSFWIRTTTASPSLIVKEAAKIESTNVQLYRTEQTDAIYLHFNLSHNNLDDDAFLKFNSSGKVEFDTNRDAVKMQNDFFNLSVLSSDSVATSIKNLCDTLCSQEIALAVQPKSPGTYSLSVAGSAFDNLIAQLAISDKFTNKVTPWNEGQAFTFEVTNDPASSHPKRFTVLIDNNHSPRPAISFSDGALFSSVTSNIQWLLNGVEIAGATQPEYVPAQDGEYSVRTTYKGCTKTSAGYTFRVTGTNNPLTSEIRLYPNPTRDNLTIVGIHSFSTDVEYNITSLAGASIQTGAIEFSENGEGSIQLRSIAQGFYILNVKNGTQRYQLKFSVR
jgi:hypothetical protein